MPELEGQRAVQVRRLHLRPDPVRLGGAAAGGGGGGFGGYGGGYGGGRWATDFPDSDLNFSYRLQQLTSLKVNPDPITLRLTDERLFDYPFIYIIEPGRPGLLRGGGRRPPPLPAQRRLPDGRRLLGRLRVRELPPRDQAGLPRPRAARSCRLDHEIFQCVYRLKEKPQVPSIGAAKYGRDRGITWEEGHGGNTREVHYRGIKDDKGRLMAMICHNTDLGDGWEREGEDPWYFKEFSEKKAYPMGINIVTYAMTH